MNNSKKEEPPIELISSLIPNYNDLFLDSFEFSEEICKKNLYSISKNSTYETFNFKIKQIHKYSTGLIVILFIQAWLFIILFLLFLISLTTSSMGLGKIFMCYLIAHIIMTIILSLLNLVFFILLSVNFYKGKIDEFKDFSECFFFDKTNFDKTFEYIYLIYKNCKKIFIVDLIYLCISFYPLFMKFIFNGCDKW